MKRLQAIAEGISRVGAIVGGAMLLLASVTICVDIVLRYTFSMTLGGADENFGNYDKTACDSTRLMQSSKQHLHEWARLLQRQGPSDNLPAKQNQHRGNADG